MSIIPTLSELVLLAVLMVVIVCLMKMGSFSEKLARVGCRKDLSSADSPGAV